MTTERELDRVARLRDPMAVLDEMGAPIDAGAYDWSTAAAQPLTDEELFQLKYAAQVEWGTENTFDSLDISRDPLVKRFLRIWLEQEVVHAQLFSRLLAAHGVVVDPLHRTRQQRFAAWRGKWLNHLARLLVGDDFFAVHMTWGAVNELTTQRFYGVLHRTTRNELLRTILHDVMVQEALHYSFYRNVAIRRLTDNPRGQRVVRLALTKLWSPVGVGLRSRDDAARLSRGLFGGRDDVVTQIDSQLHRIPGLDGLHLIRRTVDGASLAA
jgi:hypothetical protein